MRAADIIIKKRDKKELSKEEIDFFINRLANGEKSDCQISAGVIAVQLS